MHFYVILNGYKRTEGVHVFQYAYVNICRKEEQIVWLCCHIVKAFFTHPLEQKMSQKWLKMGIPHFSSVYISNSN